MGDVTPRSIKLAEYGKTSQTLSRTPSGTLLDTVSATLQLDPKIVDTLNNVSAYTTLETSQKLYDYCSYHETTASGIATARKARYLGSVLDVTPYNLTIDSNASSVFSYNGGASTITIKANQFTGVLLTDALITLTNATIAGYYTDSTGTSGYMTIDAVSGSSIAVYD